MKIPGINLGTGTTGETAYHRRTLSADDDFGPRNTETEAPESTRNSLPDRTSFRNRRVELQNSSGAEDMGETTGWTGESTCLTTVSRKGTGCPEVIGFLAVFLVKPAETRRSRGSGCRSWSRRTLGERRRLHGDRGPWGARGREVHLRIL